MSYSSTINRVPAWSLAIVAMILIQLGSALSVTVIDDIGPAGTAWLRMLLGAFFLWLFARPVISAIKSRDIFPLILLGATSGFMTTFFLSALERIPLGTTVAIEFLGPLLVAAFSSKKKSALVWPTLAFAGVLLLTEPWLGEIDSIGVMFAAMAGVCWGLYNIFTQKIGDRFTGISGLTLSLTVAALATSFWGLPQVLQGEMNLKVALLVVLIALATPTISFSLEMLALKRMNQTAFGTLLAIEPGFGALMGALILSQSPGPMQLIGMALVIGAGAAAQRDGNRS